MTVFILISILIFLVLAITRRVLIFPTVIVNLLISPFIQLLLYAFWNSVTDAYILRFLRLDELTHSLVQNVLLNSGNTLYLEDYFAWHQYSRSFTNVFCSMTFCYKFDEGKKNKKTNWFPEEVTVSVEFVHSPHICMDFLQHSKDVYMRWTGVTKLSHSEWLLWVWVWVHPMMEVQTFKVGSCLVPWGM